MTHDPKVASASADVTLTPARWHQISEIAADCLEIADEAEREAHLLRACGDDDALRERVRSVIKADASAKQRGALSRTRLASAVGAALGARDSSTQSWIGRRLGAYEITSEIAQGGMGAVFKATRADAAFNKQVAIKLIRDGVGGQQSADIAARFRAERQILASLDHPNIARLIDGGSSDDGHPYLVMEYVDGQPINVYAQSHNLSIAKKLALFQSVCSAVQFAHQRLVVHRDLKPSNILVTESGDVKLLDFGIAKLLEPPSLDPANAAPTVIAMTPAYASPEQVKGETITTASDVYALGVILYELLTGHSPYKAKATQPLELAKEICEQEPARPSTVVTHTTQATGDPPPVDETAIKRLQKGLRGDLDNIVLMALRKEPARRYASVLQLAEDVRRHTENLPVSARADTFAYRGSKFVQRNRWAVLFASLAAVGLLGGIVATTYQARVARAAQVKAERHFTDIRQISNTMLFELFDEIREVPGTLKAQQSLLKKATDYLDRLAGDAVDDAELLAEAGVGFGKLAQLYANVLLQDQAADQYARRSLSLLDQAFAIKPDSATIALSLTQAYARHGQILDGLRKDNEAVAMLEKAIAFSAALPLPLQTVDQKLARGRAWFNLNTTTALTNVLDRRIIALNEARTIFDEIAKDAATTPLAEEAQRLSLIASTSLAGAEMGKPGNAGLAAAYDAIQRAVAGHTERIRSAQGGSAAVREKKSLALAHIRLATVLQRMGRGSERLDSLRLAERYGDELVNADPADMHSQLIRLSANTAMLEALYDETQIGQVVTLAAGVLARLDQLPEQVREQLQGKNIRGSVLITLGRAQAALAENDKQTNAARLAYWQDALKNLTTGLETQMSIKALFQDGEAKAFDDTRKAIARAESEIARLSKIQGR